MHWLTYQLFLSIRILMEQKIIYLDTKIIEGIFPWYLRVSLSEFFQNESLLKIYGINIGARS